MLIWGNGLGFKMMIDRVLELGMLRIDDEKKAGLEAFMIHHEEGVYVPELIFGHLLTSSNYDDAEKKTTGGRNGYGAKLTNIFSTEFVIETADGKRQRKYKQVFSNNMGKKSEPIITKCKASENWTKVSFKPDLAKFNMEQLEADVVALMRKRVIDLGGCLRYCEGEAQ
ncbi:hypothetical protein K7X08_008182 [Anisodus acutangulus]|uniref:DNA topoisomerase (ATP-hydrolyzing) n=1 Tax=Anisodus acutangulus TaxID=402998 RepID=A0A9Q1MTZ3_9SOLA|nr:hypothetical protein K7X08_008182 [Anisodus acutangulus]